MRLPDQTTHRLIDCLTRSNLSFALYRLPWTDECYFVMQTSGEVEKLNNIADLNGKKGFVIAPFHLSDEHPLVVIRPDITAFDWNEITQSLTSLPYTDALLTCRKLPGSPLATLTEEERYDRYSWRLWKASGSRNWYFHAHHSIRWMKSSPRWKLL